LCDSKNTQVRFKLGEYFRPGSHKLAISKGDIPKRAISLPELTEQTNNFSVKNRPGCTPALLKSNPKELFLGYNVTCTLKNSDPAGHDVKVHFDLSGVTDASTAKNLDVAVSCSCPAFLYWGAQWNAHQLDALEGEPRPLLTAPTERLDLRDGFVICKHVKAVSERILPSVQHNIVKILRQRHLDEQKKEETKQQKSPRPSLQQRQDEMRERQLQKRRKAPTQKTRNKDVREQLQRGLEKRDQPLDDVVQRDTPATPEEQQRVPTIEPDTVLPPAVALAPIPELDDEDDIVPVPVPPSPPKAQQMPVMTQKDKEQMNRLMRDEQQKQMREEQQRRNRETQQRLRTNPGRR
jgi:hypothetical protein